MAFLDAVEFGEDALEELLVLAVLLHVRNTLLPFYHLVQLLSKLFGAELADDHFLRHFLV